MSKAMKGLVLQLCFHEAPAKVPIPLARRMLKQHVQLGVEADTRQLVVQ